MVRGLVLGAALVLLMAQAPAPTPVEQRLGVIIGQLIVENSKLIVELEAVKAELAKLKAERRE